LLVVLLGSVLIIPASAGIRSNWSGVGSVILCPPANGFEPIALFASGALFLTGCYVASNTNNDNTRLIAGLTTAAVGGFYVWYTLVTWE
jgi:hypothetical protein